jgi:hypothetical protein
MDVWRSEEVGERFVGEDGGDKSYDGFLDCIVKFRNFRAAGKAEGTST